MVVTGKPVDGGIRHLGLFFFFFWGGGCQVSQVISARFKVPYTKNRGAFR